MKGEIDRWINRERERDLLFHLLMHSLVASCMCPDRGPNLQTLPIRPTLQPIELPGQGHSLLIIDTFQWIKGANLYFIKSFDENVIFLVTVHVHIK